MSDKAQNGSSAKNSWRARLEHFLNREMTRQDYKSIGTALLIVSVETAGISGFFYLVNATVSLFPDYVKYTLIQQILGVLVQVNGILLGFAGLIFAQLLWSLNSQQSVAYDRVLGGSMSLGERTRTLRTIKSIHSKRRNLILAMFAVALLFLLSIIFCLANIANTQIAENPSDVLSARGYLSLPITFLFAGAVLSIVTAASASLIPKELEKTDGKYP